MSRHLGAYNDATFQWQWSSYRGLPCWLEEGRRKDNMSGDGACPEYVININTNMQTCVYSWGMKYQRYLATGAKSPIDYTAHKVAHLSVSFRRNLSLVVHRDRFHPRPCSRLDLGRAGVTCRWDRSGHRWRSPGCISACAMSMRTRGRFCWQRRHHRAVYTWYHSA